MMSVVCKGFFWGKIKQGSTIDMVCVCVVVWVKGWFELGRLRVTQKVPHGITISTFFTKSYRVHMTMV